MKLKIDFTAQNGISEELEKYIIEAVCKSSTYLLCAEGSREATSTKHYHLHAYVDTPYKRIYDYRKRVLKPAYEKAGVPCGKRAVCIKEITDLQGALSYIYKEKRVVCSSGVMLDRS